jgi:hypothetical protein
MIANGMPSLRYAPHKIWMLYSRVAEHEKGSPGLMPGENV